MAYLDDLTDEERRQQAAGGSAPAGGTGGGGVSAASGSAPAPSSGFANLSNYFTANRDAATAQGEATAAGLEGKAEHALRADSPGEAMSTLGEVNAGATPGGLASVLDAGDKDPGYTAGMAGLDAYLGTRGAAPGRFEGLRKHFGARLGRVEAPVEAPPLVAPYDPFNRDTWGDRNAPAVDLGTNLLDPNDPRRTASTEQTLNLWPDWSAWQERRRQNIEGEDS